MASYRWVHDANKVFLSPAMRSLHGDVAAQLDTKAYLALIHPEDRPRIKGNCAALLEKGDSYSREFRILRPDGTERAVHDTGIVERDADGRGAALHGVLIDVTHHHRNLVDRKADDGDMPAALYEYDVAKDLSWWSAGAFRVFRIDPVSAISPAAATERRVHPDDRGWVLESINRFRRSTGSYDMTFRVVDDDGSVRWILDRGYAYGPLDPKTGLAHVVRGSLTDVTAIKTAEERVRSFNHVLTDLIDKSPFGVYVLDDSLKIVMASKAALRAFEGIDPVIGCAIWDALLFQWPEDKARDIYRHFEHTLRTGEPYKAPTLVEKRQDRDRVESYDWHLTRTVLPDGRFGVVCHFYDLTEREAQQAALRDANDRLEMAYDAAGMAAWDLDVTTGKAIWTDRMYALLGIDPDTPATADTFFEVIHPEDRDATAAAVEAAMTEGATFDTDFRINRPNGDIRHIAGCGRVVDRAPDGTPLRMIGVNYDVTDRRRMARRLRTSEKRLRLVLDNSIAFTGLLDLEGTLIEANRPALDAAGIDRTDVLNRPFWEADWWNYDPAIADQLRAAIRDAAAGEVQRYDVPVRMMGDTLITIDFMLSPIRNDNGDVTLLVASGYDVTDRNKAMERTRILLHEINHRSKNLLTLVDVIARQTVRRYPDEFMPQFQSRLRSLAAAQDLLVRDMRDGAQLGELIEAQMAHIEAFRGDRLHLSGPDVFIPAGSAQAVGMVFHELSTNASKYGALSNEHGHVKLDWRIEPDQDGTGTLVLDWSEHDGPAVTAPSRKGFGSFVLTSMVADTMAAEIDMEFAPSGFRWWAVCRDGFKIDAPD